MSLVIVETAVEQPLSDEYLHDADQRIIPCLHARNIMWRYSLLSIDRCRMICMFDAPDAESVRDSYRRAGLFSRPTWTGDLIKLEVAQRQRDLAVRYVMEGTYPASSDTNWSEISSKLHACAEHNFEWLQAYLSRDRTRIICELNAPDIESVREAQRYVGLHFDQIWVADFIAPLTATR